MDKVKLLKVYLWVFGLLNIFVISFTIPLLFGDLLLWHPRNLPTEMMMSVIYFSMGILMINCAGQPQDHKSFIDFLIIANILHSAVMLFYADNTVHIMVDSLSIGSMGVIPLFIYPWGYKNFLRSSSSIEDPQA